MTATARNLIIDALRSGDLLTRARLMRLAAVYLALMAASLVAMIALSDGFQGRGGRPLGTDFIA